LTIEEKVLFLMPIENYSSFATIVGGGFFGGVLIGYFLRKIIRILMFVLGGILTLLLYLQYQGIVSINIDKLQASINGILNSISNIGTADTSIIPLGQIIPFPLSDLSIPLTGSIAAGFTVGIMRG
jgi:uncharacterized membrane protein (Fun14 family)